MTTREKVMSFMKAQGWDQKTLSEASGVAASRISDLVHDRTGIVVEKGLLLLRTIRRQYPGATLDWLYDEGQSWPPPDMQAGVSLNTNQRQVLEWLDAMGFDEMRRRVLLLENPRHGGLEVEDAPGEPPAAGKRASDAVRRKGRGA